MAAKHWQMLVENLIVPTWNWTVVRTFRGSSLIFLCKRRALDAGTRFSVAAESVPMKAWH
jgi:hypothetical protein